MATLTSPAKQEWKAHWPTVMSGMIGMSFYSMLTYQFGLFIQPLQNEFHWNREDISNGLAIYTLGAFFFGPFIGAMIDRKGSRKIGIFGIACTAVTLALLSQANGSITQWYLLWLAIAATALFVKSTVWGAAVSSLFTAGRSMALAVVLSGAAIAQFLSPMVARWLIDHRGWREAYQWIGFGWGGIALVLLLLFFYDAHDKRRNTVSNSGPISSLGGLTVSEALRDSRILRIAVANLFMSLVGAGISVHLVPILSGHGIDRTGAATIAGVAGIAGLTGKLLTGFLLERFEGSVIPFFSFAFGAVGYFLLLNTFGSTSALLAGAMIIAYTSGAGLQVTTYLISRYGGLRNFGKIFATIASMMMFGTAFGPKIAGRVFDINGSYQLLLTIAIPVVLVSSAMFIGLGRYPVFDDPTPERMLT